MRAVGLPIKQCGVENVPQGDGSNGANVAEACLPGVFLIRTSDPWLGEIRGQRHTTAQGSGRNGGTEGATGRPSDITTLPKRPPETTLIFNQL